MARKNAFYAQSGGVSAVINASACGVLQTARQHSTKIGKVYAGRDGIIGALTEDLIDTSLESESAVAALKRRVRVLPLQAWVDSRASRTVRALGRSVSCA